jgi:effector-binding domain-containing protein
MLGIPHVLQTEERHTAVIHLTVPRAEIASVMGPAISEIMSALAIQGVAPAGPLFSYHLKRPSDIFDVEVGFPVDQPIAPAGRVKTGKLPAAKVVRTTYQGGYEGLGAAWGEFCAWIDAEGLDPQDSLWERYLVGPESSPDPEQWQTELNRPLKP